MNNCYVATICYLNAPSTSCLSSPCGLTKNCLQTNVFSLRGTPASKDLGVVVYFGTFVRSICGGSRRSRGMSLTEQSCFLESFRIEDGKNGLESNGHLEAQQDASPRPHLAAFVFWQQPFVLWTPSHTGLPISIWRTFIPSSGLSEGLAMLLPIYQTGPRRRVSEGELRSIWVQEGGGDVRSDLGA